MAIPLLEPDRAALQTALDLSSEPVMICSCSTQPPHVIYTNSSFERLTGYTAEDICGQAYDRHLSGSAEDSIRQAVQRGQSATAKLCYRHRNGAELQIELCAAPTQISLGQAAYYAMTLRDLAHARHQVEHLKFIANHDALTGLPNRRLLLDRMEQALARYRRSGEAFTVAFIDVNELKQVNDRFGHTTGDELLQHVARCLASSIRSCDTVARYGGDEFVLLLTAAVDSDSTAQTVARALQSLNESLTLGDQTFNPTCSIGIAVCPRDGLDAATLLHAADGAMYRAKLSNRATSSVHGL